MIKIMFVCHGNICRSPMAEFIFRDIVKRQGLEDEFSCASCATSTEEIYAGIGNPVYPPAKAELAKHGLSCEGKRAVQLKKSDYHKYTLFVCMDDNNYKNTIKIFGSDSDRKVSKLLDYVGGGNVADPWYSGRFDVAYNDIYKGCEGFLDYLLFPQKD